MMSFRKYSILISFLLLSISLISQSYVGEEKYYIWFDQIIGQENTSLFNGKTFIYKYRTEKGNHNYFRHEEFSKGLIYYKEQSYFDIDLKYDIHNDEIIVNLKGSFGYNMFIPHNEFIKGFQIYDRDFVKLNLNSNGLNLKGFYEVSYNGIRINLYTKHYKPRREYVHQNTVLSRFSEKNKNIVHFKDAYYLVESKKDIQQIFPNIKDKINLIYKQYKSLKKSDPDIFMKDLMRQIDDILRNKAEIE